MKTLILYSTKYGCAEECAKELASRLGGDTVLVNLKKEKVPPLNEYDRVIIGGSIYVGKIQKVITRYIDDHRSELKAKKLGLFFCCMSEGDMEKTQLKSAFPADLTAVAAATENFGGEFKISKMNFLDRFIVKKISKVECDTKNLLQKNIDRFVVLMNS